MGSHILQQNIAFKSQHCARLKKKVANFESYKGMIFKSYNTKKTLRFVEMF